MNKSHNKSQWEFKCIHCDYHTCKTSSWSVMTIASVISPKGLNAAFRLSSFVSQLRLPTNNFFDISLLISLGAVVLGRARLAT